ncbi:MAG: hypothetical protein IPK70_10085 [Flavobacteriales bacterium]|nr:hypothetical protein [Flavobacteriales bacterium]
MRHAISFLLAVMLASASAQPGAKAEAIAQAKALAEANADLEREAASVKLKNALRALLDAPGAMELDLADLPLSRVDAPDGGFRLITWNLPQADGTHRYEGFLLARKGKLTTLHELRDMTSGIANPELAELSPDRWYGALYYEVIPVKKGGRTWYTLLGWKGHSATETRKVIEVLSFRGNRPRFGAPLFGKGKLSEQRKAFSYAFNASMMLRYDREQGRIVLDHLAPIRADLQGRGALMGPDMSFDAFAWQKGQWRYQRDIDLRDPNPDKRPFNNPPKEPRK